MWPPASDLQCSDNLRYAYYMQEEGFGYVYFVTVTNIREYMKIGYASNLKKRFQNLHVMNPFLTCLGLLRSDIDSVFALEKIIHQELKKYRSKDERKSEWYELESVLEIVRYELKNPKEGFESIITSLYEGNKISYSICI